VTSESLGQQQWVAIAQVIRPRGIRGEVEAVPLSNQEGRFEQLREVYPGGTEAGGALEVETVWEYRGRLVFKFRGVDSIPEAERLRGVELRIPLESRMPLPAGEFYQSDLIGCEVFERAGGQRLGFVAQWRDSGGAGLLEVQGDAGEILIPFARAICVEIDPQARRILVDLPEGLRELNR
jgi:16S rRNA processing protein RimM